jgi:predicted  nucleic acid-binding Zn-ribbon protein
LTLGFLGVEVSESREILDFLRANFGRVNDRLDRVDIRLDELITRTSSLERDVASLNLRAAELKIDFAAMQNSWIRRTAGSIESSGVWSWWT